jgi:hypothetical protein
MKASKKITAQLAARRKDFDQIKPEDRKGLKRPGSLSGAK